MPTLTSILFFQATPLPIASCWSAKIIGTYIEVQFHGHRILNAN